MIPHAYRFLILLLLTGLLWSSAAQNLSVSENGRYLTYEDGRPFFYLGDTAWELFHRLSLEEAERYLAVLTIELPKGLSNLPS